MSFSTANGQLRKMIMFDLVKKCGLDICHRCGHRIDNIDDFSIEHKTPWLHSDNVIELFFDITNNIAFSHIRCNIMSARISSVVNAKSGYKGVTYENNPKRVKPWRAVITMRKGKVIKSRGFTTPEDAALEYDKMAIEYFKDRAVTNRSLGLV